MKPAGPTVAGDWTTFVTEEPDGLFYVWHRIPPDEPDCTYAFKTKGEAVEHMRTVVDDNNADEFSAT